MSLLRRGDLVALRAPKRASGREQQARRYGVVVQASELAGLSTVVVAPTSTSAQATAFRPQLTVRRRRTRVLVDQIRTVDREHLGGPVGHLAAHELRDVDEALKIVLGLF